MFHLLNEETGEPVENPIRKVLDTGRIIGLANHTVLLNRQGQYIPIADSAAPIKTGIGEPFGVVMVFRDVGDEKEHNKQIEFLSYHDPLTGLFNRRYIEKIMGSLDVEENLPISVIIGDVNGLKVTNDIFGQQSGDTLLKNVTNLFRENCKVDDLIARWGGDEFVAFMLRTSQKDAEKVVHNIMNTRISVNGSDLLLSMSLGCASKERMDTGIEAVLREAEESMYHQKLLNDQSYRNAITNILLLLSTAIGADTIKRVICATFLHKDGISPVSKTVSTDFFAITNHAEPAAFMQTNACRVILHNARLQHPKAAPFRAVNQLKKKCFANSPTSVTLCDVDAYFGYSRVDTSA